MKLILTQPGCSLDFEGLSDENVILVAKSMQKGLEYVDMELCAAFK